uniref:Uncharacterized protein n=1 Tax=Opuntia streptacantha TaxID=393608 RepID=A0A7C9DB47_OPUST
MHPTLGDDGSSKEEDDLRRLEGTCTCFAAADEHSIGKNVTLLLICCSFCRCELYLFLIICLDIIKIRRLEFTPSKVSFLCDFLGMLEWGSRRESGVKCSVIGR